MAWSSGTFSRSNGATGWATDEAGSIGIESGRHDTHDQDLATGINNCLTKDGQNTPSANLPMGGFKHTNVDDATARTEYARADQVQDGSLIYGGTTSGSANAHTLSLTPAITSYTAGRRIRFISGFDNTGATTLNVNSVGTRNVRLLAGGVDLPPDTLRNGQEYEVLDDGTQFILMDGLRPCVIHRSTSTATITGVTTEQTIKSFTVPANTIGVQSGIRFRAYFETNANGFNIIFRGKWGSTTFWNSGGTASIFSGATNKTAYVEGTIMGNNSASSLVSQVGFFAYLGAGASDGGELVSPTTYLSSRSGITDAATSSQALTLTVQPSNSGVVVTCKQFVVEAI